MRGWEMKLFSRRRIYCYRTFLQGGVSYGIEFFGIAYERSCQYPGRAKAWQSMRYRVMLARRQVDRDRRAERSDVRNEKERTVYRYEKYHQDRRGRDTRQRRYAAKGG